MANLVYILAASHSGSTLLAMLLGAHPDAVTVGELAPGGIGEVDTYRCSCRRLFTECPFWQQVADEMARRDADFQLTDFRTRFQSPTSLLARRLLRPLHRGRFMEALRDLGLRAIPSWRAEYPRLLYNNRALIETIASVTGRRVVIDSSKTALRLKYLLRIPALKIKVIRLIRDGRGIALAYMDPAGFADAREPALRGGGNGAGRDGERLSPAKAAREWRRSNEEAEHALVRLDNSQWIEVRYEQLCSDPDAMLGSICSFLDLDPKRMVRDFRSVEHHVIGNGMRMDSTSEVRLDERWKTVLKDEDLRIIRAAAGETLRRYGYE